MPAELQAIGRWADEEPAALLWLLRDGVLRAQVLDAMRALGFDGILDQAEGAAG